MLKESLQVQRHASIYILCKHNVVSCWFGERKKIYKLRAPHNYGF